MKSFLNEFAHQLKEQWGNQLQSVAIVVNNKRPISFLQHHLSESITEPIWSPQFYTIDEWMSLVDNSHRVDEIEEFFILYEAYNQLLVEEGIQTISQDEFLAFSDIIRQDFSQIMNYLVNAEDLFKYLEDVAMMEVEFPTLTEEQMAYLSQFWSAIQHENPLDAQQRFIRLWMRIGKLIQNFKAYLIKNEKTTLAFSFKRVAENPSSFLDKLPFQHIYFVGFNATHPALQKVVNYLETKNKITLVHDWDAYYVDNKLNKAGLFFRQQEKNIEDKIDDLPHHFQEPKKIHVYGMEGNIAQAKYLNQLLPTLVDGKSIGLEDIAVVLADENMAIPVMQSIPNDLVYNLSMGYPLQHGNIYRWLDWFLSLQEYYQQNTYLRVPKELILKGSVLIKSEFPLLEVEWEAFLKANEKSPYISVQGLSKFDIALLSPIRNSMDLLAHVRQFIQSRLEILENQEEHQKLEANLMLYTYKIFESFYYNVTTHHRQIEPVVLIRLLRKKLQQLNVPLSGYDLEAVQVLGFLETRAIDFKKVVLLNANEGIIPSLSQRPSLIPDSIRRAFQLPVLEHQDALVAHVFYSMLQRAEEIHVFYDQTISTQSTGEVTRFIKQIAFESQHEVQYHFQEQNIAPGPKVEPMVIEKTPEISQKLQQQFLQPQGRTFTASSLNSYLNCSLTFYLKYIEGFREQDDFESALDARIVGSVIHDIMDDCYRGFIGKEVTADDITAMQKGLKRRIDSKVKEHLQIEDLNAEASILIELADHAVNTFLKTDKRHSPFKIIDLENDEKGEGGHNASLLIHDKEGNPHEVLLRIIVDRIDLYHGSVRLIDYKTGSIKQLNIKSLDDLFDKSKRDAHLTAIFQVMLYAWVYQKHIQSQEVLIPQVWSSRFLSQSQNEVFIKIGDTTIQPGMNPAEWKGILQAFEEKLKLLIEEIIFDHELLIQHNQEDKNSYCENNEFALFCLGQ